MLSIDPSNDKNDEVDYFLSHYGRCYVQGQEVYVEVWLEKGAPSRIFENICWQHCIRLVVNKGYQSTTFTEQYARRARLALEQGQEPVILYFGDFDPSGVDIFESAHLFYFPTGSTHLFSDPPSGVVG